ncbi:hypothetical protein ACJ72_03389 [Emergomyces africanus]|uniref:BTB domain-containing protein n=1 Tax=Emergomyces africanus TaxID=1955775 RepID=A0A1B7NZR7_9EURO|nr:hypothetical protein ACJ72_03389 [Emergomyces africanus]
MSSDNGTADRPCYTTHLWSQKYSDMTISCSTDQYHVHRVVVCNQSPFFAAALDKQFKEATAAEVVLEEDDPELVRLMIAHFYGAKDPAEIDVMRTEHSEEEPSAETKKEEPVLLSATEPSHKALINARLYAMGDKYGIESLKTLSQTEFDNWATNVDATEYIDDFPAIIDEVYRSTPDNDRGLRDILVPLIVDNAEVALKSQGLCDVLLLFPELQMEILRRVVKSRADLLNRLITTTKTGKKEGAEYKKYVERVDSTMTELETAFLELGKKAVGLSMAVRKGSKRESSYLWNMMGRYLV